MKAVSGILYVVKDLDRTVSFYELLGFDFKDRADNYAIGYLNWFWLEFVPQEKVEQSTFKHHIHLRNEATEGDTFLHMSVDNVDEYYKELVDKGLKPASTPKDFPWGRREFILKDPDGYKLVFFKKLK